MIHRFLHCYRYFRRDMHQSFWRAQRVADGATVAAMKSAVTAWLAGPPRLDRYRPRVQMRLRKIRRYLRFVMVY